MIRCYVVDDEMHAIETLCNLIMTTPGLELIGHNTNPLISLDYIKSNVPPDLTFVDLDMPHLHGIEFASLASQHTTIVITSAHNTFACEAFENNVFDYLLKPITHQKLLRCIKKFENNAAIVRPAANYFYIKSDVKGKIIRIDISEITYVEGARNYLIIHTNDGKQQITYLTMVELQSYLPNGNFFRIHKSYIVNNDKIKSITGSTIVLDDKTILNVSKIYKGAFYENLNKRLLKTKRII